jgi:hypothetical protein
VHGIIFTELKRYADARLGSDGWTKVLAVSGQTGKMFLATKAYPDEDAVDIVGAASRLTGLSVSAVLEDFGEFMAPSLLRVHRALVPKSWKTLDLIEHAEATIHTVVRARNPGALPPVLQARRVSPDEVLLTYASARRMCGIAKGLARGIAKEFDEQVVVYEAACMLTGAPACLITIRRL